MQLIKFLLPALLLLSCTKQLDEKPDKHLVTPSGLRDMQAIMDYAPTMYVEPGSDESSADNYYLTDATYNGLSSVFYRAMYNWQNDHLFDGTGSDWGIAYKQVYYCNVVLDGLPSIAAGDPEWYNVQGQALFKRAKTFFHVLNIWSMPYDESTAATDMGIPLRLNADFEQKSVRASVKDSYDRVIGDLKQAARLLPVTPVHPVRPSRPAAFAMLSRVYLSMRKYNEARLYADSALSLFGTLVDYNTVDGTPTYPFKNPNPETIFMSVSSNSLISTSNAKMDSVLYSSYASNDCRKTLFFKSLGNNQYSFRGSYSNSDGQFSGLATDELYLTRAECFARDGKTTEALADLNALLAKRYKAFSPVTAVSAADALAKILVERRKELVMRFVRWMDIRRLNKEGAGIIPKRLIGGVYYQLSPGDLRYALPLPEDVIAISGMPQNPR